MNVDYVGVFEAVPHCDHSGGGITAYSAIVALKNRGHRVHAIAINSSEYNGPHKTEKAHIAHLESLGITVEVLNGLPPIHEKLSLFKKFFPKSSDLFYALKYREQVRKRLEELKPKAVLMYHWNALAATYGVNQSPKLGLVGDPAHLPALFRRQMKQRYEFSELASLKQTLKDLLITPRQVSWMKKFMNDCKESGAFAAHHAEMLRDWGIPKCRYFRTPTPDPGQVTDENKKSSVFKIVHIGHLQGIATISGVELLANEILPILRKSLPPKSFEIHLVGGFFETLPKQLQNALKADEIKVRGQITPADPEFLSAHVILVPTPIDLGIRVRILTALSFGSCIIAHEANKKGIPELASGVNSLLGKSGAELADHCISIMKNPELRKKLEQNARKEYDRSFSLQQAGNEIAKSLESLASKTAL